MSCPEIGLQFWNKSLAKMNDHLQALLDGRQYSEEIKEQAAMRVVFGGEDPNEVIRIMHNHNVYVLNNWVNNYRKKIEDGLITLPAMTEKQRQDIHLLRQRNKELEKALKDANLMIL